MSNADEAQISADWRRSILVFFLWILPLGAFAASPKELILSGNEAYEDGKFAEALEKYESAAEAAPDLAEVAFNRGAALYQKGEFDAAVFAFQKASIEASQPGLSSRAKYNLGACAYRQAEAAREEDLEKAIEFCKASMTSFREALDLDPDYREAAENLEISRILYRRLLDQQEQEGKDDEAEEDLAEKLKKLLERQLKASEQSQQLLATKTDSQSWKGGVEHVEEAQKQLQRDTADVLTDVQEQAEAGAMPEKIEKVAEHVRSAIDEQGFSLDPLNRKELEVAQPHQQRAAEELKKALEALSDPNQQDQQNQDQQQDGEDQQQEQSQDGEDQQQQQQSQDGEDQQQQQQSQDGEEQQQQQSQDGEEQQQQQSQDGEEQEEGEDQQQAQSGDEEQEGEEQRQAQAKPEEFDPEKLKLMQMDEEAKSILEQEEKRRARRIPIRIGVGRGVDKDW